MDDPTLRALGAYALVCYVTAIPFVWLLLGRSLGRTQRVLRSALWPLTLLAGLVVVYGRPIWRRLVMWWEAAP